MSAWDCILLYLSVFSTTLSVIVKLSPLISHDAIGCAAALQRMRERRYKQKGTTNYITQVIFLSGGAHC